MSYQINKLQKENDELENKIILIEENINESSKKESELMHHATVSTIIGGTGYFFGSFIHPAIGVASLLYLFLNMLPSGLMIINHQDKQEKYKLQIEEHKKTINQNKIHIDKLLKELELDSKKSYKR